MTAITDCLDFNPNTIVLRHGSHGTTFKGEACLVECAAVASVCIPELREKYGAAKVFDDDHPSISRVVRAMAIGLNDLQWESDDARSAALRPFITRVLGTKTTTKDETTRAYMACDWLVRQYTPAWLRLAGLTDHAQLLEGLARIADAKSARAAQPTIDSARNSAAAAWAAAGDAARDAAGAAARAAAGAAAWAAARDAARAAAWAAAWAAAGAAAGAAARAAAGAAAWAAARDAARAALAPTALARRASAIVLLGEMCDVGRVHA